MMSRRSVQCLAAGGVLAVSFVVTGCSKDKPAICSDVDALKSSVADVTSVSLDKSSLAALPGDVARVQSDLSTVMSAVKTQYATEIADVDRATSNVRSTLQAATASPSVSTLAALGTAVKALGASLTALETAVKDTC